MKILSMLCAAVIMYSSSVAFASGPATDSSASSDTSTSVDMTTSGSTSTSGSDPTGSVGLDQETNAGVNTTDGDSDPSTVNPGNSTEAR